MTQRGGTVAPDQRAALLTDIVALLFDHRRGLQRGGRLFLTVKEATHKLRYFRTRSTRTSATAIEAVIRRQLRAEGCARHLNS